MTKRNSTDAIASKQVQQRGGYRKKLTTSEFLAKAVGVHGSTYNYNQVEYINSKTKVKIVCKSHGVFYQSPNTHLAGQGCPHCYNERRFLTQEQFVAKSQEMHGNLYDYSRSMYYKNNIKVTIICNRCHEVFEQAPQDHMRGYGCYSCHLRNIGLTQNDFIEQGKSVHGRTKFNYSYVEYVNKTTKVRLVCNGCKADFMQEPYGHLLGYGCSNCARANNGFNRSSFIGSCDKNNNGSGTLYVVRCVSGEESFIKIGITSKTVRERFVSGGIPYEYKEMYLITEDSRYIYDLELMLHKMLRRYKQKPLVEFAGMTECFSTIKPIEKLLKELSITEQLQLLA